MLALTAIQGHRGSPDPANLVRENTLEAFARAARLGGDEVELDARMTDDGLIVVHHDPMVTDDVTLARTALGRT